jgi:hypothetical protein
MGICACSTYFLVVAAAFLLPETRGRDLRAVTATASPNAAPERATRRLETSS